ncbi:MAG TPA: alpha/beta fold hydrolase [Propionibacteriaceae bacterium]|nr:alpha/beta fold hydrolase [Propionibacteriaceae bacterium]
MLDALSPQRRRLVLGAGGLALLLIMTLAVFAVVRVAARSVDPVPQTAPGPVLLVPGYGGNVDSLQPLAAAMRSAGRSVVIVEPLGDGTGDLRQQAEHLAEVAERVRDDAGAASVDVVGYSAGGVVARLWVREEGGADMTRRVLTLGSPHHGTSQAALGAEFAGGCPAACEQLVPDSDLLRRLNAGDETPAGPLWATVRSTNDQVVTPVDSAALSGALNIVVQEVCPRATAAHSDLPTDPVVVAALSSVLGVAAPQAPSNVAC